MCSLYWLAGHQMAVVLKYVPLSLNCHHMFSLSVLSINDNLEAPDKHTGVYITHDRDRGTVCSCPVSCLGHVSHNETLPFEKWENILNL